MKKLLIAFGVLVLVLIGGLLALPGLVPADKLKAQVVDAVKSATGRDLVIDGKVAVTGFPSLGVQVSNISLSNPPGFLSKDMVRLGSLDVQLRLMPLLSGRVEISSFVLVDPVITLEVNRQGQANWVFDQAGKPAQPASTPSTRSAPSSSGGTPLADISLGDVKLSNGKLTYVDAKAGTREEVDALNLTLSLKNLDNPFKAKGGLKYKAKAIDLDADIASPRALLDGTSTKANLAIVSDVVTLTFDGTLEGGKNAGAKGITGLTVPSIRALTQWASGKPLEGGGSGLGPLSIKGNLSAGGGRFGLTGTDISLDSIKAKGDFTVDTNGPHPALKGKLDVENLDLNPYLAQNKETAKPASPASAPAGQKQSSGWSDDPIDLSALKAADVNFTLSVATMVIQDIKVGQSALLVELAGGRLNAVLSELNLYKGNGSGKVTLDGSGAVPALAAQFALKNLAAEPFLKDAAGFDRIDGTAATDFQISAQGKSQRALVQNLNGKGQVTFLNGSIKGINLAEMIRNVTTAFSGGAASQSKTDFAELGGTYTISDGILTNKDLSLKSPLLRVEGTGTVELPPRTVHYRVTPKAVASLEGQGGKTDLGGIAVPVIIEGPWDKLSFRPDLAAMVQGKASQAISDAVGGKLGGSTGGGSALPLNPGKLFGR